MKDFIKNLIEEIRPLMFPVTWGVMIYWLVGPQNLFIIVLMGAFALTIFGSSFLDWLNIKLNKESKE